MSARSACRVSLQPSRRRTRTCVPWRTLCMAWDLIWSPSNREEVNWAMIEPGRRCLGYTFRNTSRVPPIITLEANGLHIATLIPACRVLAVMIVYDRQVLVISSRSKKQVSLFSVSPESNGGYVHLQDRRYMSEYKYIGRAQIWRPYSQREGVHAFGGDVWKTYPVP